MDQTIEELWSTVDVGLWEVYSQLSGYETATSLGERSGDSQGGDTKHIKRKMIAIEYTVTVRDKLR